MSAVSAPTASRRTARPPTRSVRNKVTRTGDQGGGVPDAAYCLSGELRPFGEFERRGSLTSTAASPGTSSRTSRGDSIMLKSALVRGAIATGVAAATMVVAANPAQALSYNRYHYGAYGTTQVRVSTDYSEVARFTNRSSATRFVVLTGYVRRCNTSGCGWVASRQTMGSVAPGDRIRVAFEVPMYRGNRYQTCASVKVYHRWTVVQSLSNFCTAMLYR